LRSGEVSWGAPDFGPVLLRPRLIGLIDSAGGRLRVISAPGGWGKSVLAAQWARSSEGAVLWLDSHAPECYDSRLPKPRYIVPPDRFECIFRR